MRFKVNWGYPAYIVSFFVFAMNLLFIYFSITAFHIISFIFLVPFVFLDFIFFPVFSSLIGIIIKKERYSLYITNKGIELNNMLKLWDSIKSISFQTGRLVHDYSAFQGFKLPALQRIYLLDKEGNEYTATIDIDYFMKGGRKKNNLILAKNVVFDLGKMNLLSDWAEKR